MSKTIETRARLKEYEVNSRASLRAVGLTASLSEEAYLTMTFATAHGEAKIDVSAYVPLGFLPVGDEPARYEITIRKLRAAPKQTSGTKQAKAVAAAMRMPKGTMRRKGDTITVTASKKRRSK